MLVFVPWFNGTLRRFWLTPRFPSSDTWRRHSDWECLGIALFHLMTHAFFKALMFLGSGSVIHACHHEQDIFKYGGLRKEDAYHCDHFLIGVLAISESIFSQDILVRMLFCWVLTILICRYLLSSTWVHCSPQFICSVFILLPLRARPVPIIRKRRRENNSLMTGPLLFWQFYP